MPTQTDRDKLKKMQEGHFLTADSSVADSKGTVAAAHTLARFDHRKMGSENAATNVAELPFGFVPFKARGKKFAIQTTTNIAANATDYLVVHFYGRFNGTSTVIASWNTHTSGQGALTTAGPGVISTAATGLVTNSSGILVAESGVTYDIQKVGAGKDLPAGSIISADLEEI